MLGLRSFSVWQVKPSDWPIVRLRALWDSLLGLNDNLLTLLSSSHSSCFGCSFNVGYAVLSSFSCLGKSILELFSIRLDVLTGAVRWWFKAVALDIILLGDPKKRVLLLVIILSGTAFAWAVELTSPQTATSVLVMGNFWPLAFSRTWT